MVRSRDVPTRSTSSPSPSSSRAAYVFAAVISGFLAALAIAVWALDGSSWNSKAAACIYAEAHSGTTPGRCNFYETASSLETTALVVGILSALCAVGLLAAAAGTD